MSIKTTTDNDWLYEITPKGKLIDLNFKEIWRYRDLLWIFVLRDIVTVYKQTILGPLWYIIQPLFTSVIFTLVFNGFGSLGTGVVNAFLFNMAGITIWNYFKECFVGTSDTFKKNATVFGKVYFPRVIVPMSVTVSNLLKFFIQFTLFLAFYLYFLSQGKAGEPSLLILVMPILIIAMGMIGLGLGMIISSWTTKYRDLTVVVGFGVQLLMYLSAVPYSLSEVGKSNQEWVKMATPFIKYNPLTQVVEGFRNIFFGTGIFDITMLLYVIVFSFCVFFLGLVVFNKTERNFIDTV